MQVHIVCTLHTQTHLAHPNASRLSNTTNPEKLTQKLPRNTCVIQIQYTLSPSYAPILIQIWMVTRLTVYTFLNVFLIVYTQLYFLDVNCFVVNSTFHLVIVLVDMLW